MTDLDFQRIQERIEALAAQVESLRAQLSATPPSDAPDANDFGGGGEPDWSGAMGRVPDGFIENPAIPPLPDTTAAKNPNRLQYKSIDDRGQDCAPPGVTQIHDFDEALPSGTGLRKVELKLVTTTGTGGGTFLVLVDPDDNEVPGTKWMIPLRESGTGGREIKWAGFGGKVDVSGIGGNAETDTEQNPGNPPGESVEHYHATGETGGPLQIRGFQQDAAKALRYSGGPTSGIALANAEVIVRNTTGRKRTDYVPAASFWLQGAGAAQNFATSIKLGSAANGYITIDTTS